MSKNYLIWDFDGTLGHRLDGWAGALKDVLEANGIDQRLGIESLRPFLRSGFRWHDHHVEHRIVISANEWWDELDPIFARAFHEGIGVDPQMAQRLSKMVRDAYLNVAKWNLFPDVHAALATLTESGWCHVLLTNHVPQLTSILKALGIAHHFVMVFNSAETGYEKPHPRAFENVKTKLPDSSLWMIGDNYVADIAGAAAVGIPGILVRQTHPDARRCAPDLQSLIRLLEIDAEQ